MRLYDSIHSDSAAKLLADLIALPTVNPMGRPYDGIRPVERPIVEYLEEFFAPFNVHTKRQACSPIHESLLIVVPGRDRGAGILFESHIDTVPADDWIDRAFAPRVDGGRVYGRGACDDKASLCAMMMALAGVLESHKQPRKTILLLAAADEEYAQSGIRNFVAGSPAPFQQAVIGEPTEVIPVIQQKGVIRWDITVHGRSAHTSRPENGHNAILDMLQVIGELAQHERDLQRRYVSPAMSGPTIAVTMIHGGRMRNAVPDECTIAVDFRTLPEMDRAVAMDELRQRLSTLPVSITHSEFQCNVPGLRTPPDDPFVKQVVGLCSERLGKTVMPAGVPYGSDACWIPADVSTIVLGPGDIATAHAVDESIEIEQVEHCAAIYRQLMLD